MGRNLVLVAIGGGARALLRYGVMLWIPAGTVPWSVMLINISGSFAIGAVMALTEEFGVMTEAGRLFVAVGILGGYTTFSTYINGVYRLLAADRWLPAYGYGVAVPGLGLLAAWGAIVAVRALYSARRADSGEFEEG
ncbi:MAG: CrcB family protein [Thermaerobacter sp.]|nr:CrcB family protein [Thermaerobacter sp.]